MARRLALRAKVVARLHQARAKHLLPEAIDGDAGRQRVLRRHQPLARSSRVSRCRLRSFDRRQDRRHARLDLFARLVVLPADHDERVARLLQIAKDERARRRFLSDEPAARAASQAARASPSELNGTSTSLWAMSIRDRPAAWAASRATLPALSPCRTIQRRSGQRCIGWGSRVRQCQMRI